MTFSVRGDILYTGLKINQPKNNISHRFPQSRTAGRLAETYRKDYFVETSRDILLSVYALMVLRVPQEGHSIVLFMVTGKSAWHFLHLLLLIVGLVPRLSHGVSLMVRLMSSFLIDLGLSVFLTILNLPRLFS